MKRLNIRKSLLLLILVAFFTPAILAGCGKKPEIAEPASVETSLNDETTPEESPEETVSESTEPNEKIEVASSKQTDTDKSKKQITGSKNTNANKTTQTAPTTTKKIEQPCQHNFVLASEQPTSCTASGTKVHKCTSCGQLSQEDLPAHGHNFVEVANSAPTCTTAGFHTMKCTYCSHEYSKQTAAPLGHNFTEVANSAPTCTNGGSRTMRCTYCGQEYSEQTAAPLGHAFGGWNISKNHHSHSCSRCGHTERSSHQLKDSVCQVCGVVDFR